MQDTDHKTGYSTAMALVMARTMKRVAGKYGDLALARRAKELGKEARQALREKRLVLNGRSSLASEPVTSSTVKHSRSPSDMENDERDAAKFSVGEKMPSSPETLRPLMEPGPLSPTLSEYEQDERDTEKMLRTLDQIIAKRKKEGKNK
jgi:hypothetical protein